MIIIKIILAKSTNLNYSRTRTDVLQTRPVWYLPLHHEQSYIKLGCYNIMLFAAVLSSEQFHSPQIVHWIKKHLPQYKLYFKLVQHAKKMTTWCMEKGLLYSNYNQQHKTTYSQKCKSHILCIFIFMPGQQCLVSGPNHKTLWTNSHICVLYGKLPTLLTLVSAHHCSIKEYTHHQVNALSTALLGFYL